MRTTDRDMLWSGWGDPERAAPLPDAVTGLLRDLLGVKPRGAATVALEDLAVPASPLTPDAHRALAAALGDDAHVRTDAETRVRHTRGKSTPDLLRMRDGDLAAALPAAVVLPAAHDEVLRPCSGSAPHTAWPPSRSAAAPPSSADSPPRRAAPSSPSTCGA
ncbi:hypothetical protein SALBM217S_01194 [Streptomyces griseoloalbus]